MQIASTFRARLHTGLAVGMPVIFFGLAIWSLDLWSHGVDAITTIYISIGFDLLALACPVVFGLLAAKHRARSFRYLIEKSTDSELPDAQNDQFSKLQKRLRNSDRQLVVSPIGLFSSVAIFAFWLYTLLNAWAFNLPFHLGTLEGIIVGVFYWLIVPVSSITFFYVFLYRWRLSFLLKKDDSPAGTKNV